MIITTTIIFASQHVWILYEEHTSITQAIHHQPYSSITMSTSTTPEQPKLTKDPRFRAARKLIESGRDGAIDMFATLLEEARTKYGEASIETAPAYFEYGGALFRESQRQKQEAEKNEGEGEEEEGEEGEEQEEEDKKPAAKETENGDSKANGEAGKKEENDDEDDANEDEAENEDDDQQEQATDDDDDEHLAFQMMETAFAIYDQYVQLAKSHSSKANSTYLTFAEREQLPRILSNIGDVLSAMGRHADSADAYTRELLYREANLQAYENKDMSLSELMERRKVVEANLLVASELLECPPGEDVVTQETQSCLVKAEDREDFVTGYYEQARDQLQDTVYLMAKLIGKASSGTKIKSKEEEDGKSLPPELAKEKENVCFASTMLMGVGEKLAQIKEAKEQAAEAASGKEPAKKKAKR